MKQVKKKVPLFKKLKFFALLPILIINFVLRLPFVLWDYRKRSRAVITFTIPQEVQDEHVLDSHHEAVEMFSHCLPRWESNTRKGRDFYLLGPASHLQGAIKEIEARGYGAMVVDTHKVIKKRKALGPGIRSMVMLSATRKKK